MKRWIRLAYTDVSTACLRLIQHCLKRKRHCPLPTKLNLTHRIAFADIPYIPLCFLLEKTRMSLASYLALWHTPGIGPIRFFKLIEHFPDITRLFKTSISQLRTLGLPETIALTLQNPPWREVDHALAWANHPHQHLISWTDARYPTQLKEIPDFPPFLFLRGKASLLNSPQIAVVGSRKPTPAGIQSARTFTQYLSAAGLTITSGLALGVDAVSHQSALDHQGKTIAVLGTGADKIYPFRNKKLAEDILKSGGAVISDFPLGTAPKPENFPRRNRIISGLSLGTLVIEATPKSGSLITARLANEQGRDVFALPGSIYNPQSTGCHLLIQQGAKLAQTPQDVLDELHISHSSSPLNKASASTISPMTTNSLDANSQLLLECIGFERTNVDQLIERTRLPAHIVSAIASQLELQGFIVAVPGGYFRDC
jgi:DNA processing protein